jgi:hypothetical protein
MRTEDADAYWLAFPPNLSDWPPLMALREWLQDELTASQRELDAEAVAWAEPTQRVASEPASSTQSRPARLAR